MVKEDHVVFEFTLTTTKSFLNCSMQQISKRMLQLGDSYFDVHDISMQTTPTLFKALTNFTWAEFEELALLMVPTIARIMKSIGKVHIPISHPSKLSLKQCIFKFIFYMKLVTL